MMGYFYFYQPQGVPLAQPAEEQVVEAPVAADPAPADAPAPPVAAATSSGAVVSAAPAPDVVAAAAEREITVDTDKYTVVFSNRGAVVKSWLLKNYKDALGEPLDLVHQDGAATHGYPFRLTLSGGEPVAGLDDALFTVNDGSDRRVGTTELEFRYSDGIRTATKTFGFRQEGFQLDVATELIENGSPRLHLMSWPGGFGDTAHANDYAHSMVSYWDPAEDGLERNKAADAEDTRIANQGVYPFAGIEDLFFTATFRASEAQPVQVETTAVSIDPIPGDEDPELFAGIAIGSSTGNQFELYVGPKSLDGLRAIDQRMGEIVDFGWTSFIADPLFSMLRWTYNNVVPNWGWAIVLVTIIVNIALFPLKWKGNKSTKRMQQIQPEIKRINDKYKGLKMSDPKKQQQQEETMALYKKYGVNPLGGCFPMLLQLPFFYGFYTVLTYVIEMRGAEWLWVTDLSLPESIAIRVLPLAMMGTQFWMQSLTPTPTMDPSQARIMKLMPLMMGFIFYGFGAGLVLYWLTMNLVGVGTQVILNKLPAEPLDLELAGNKPGRKKAKK